MQWNGAKDDLQVGVRDAKRPEAHSATRRRYCIHADPQYERMYLVLKYTITYVTTLSSDSISKLSWSALATSLQVALKTSLPGICLYIEVVPHRSRSTASPGARRRAVVVLNSMCQSNREGVR